MIIEFPREFAAGSLHSIWSELESLRGASQAGDVVIDLANVSYVDAEGCNYLALIPALLTQAGAHIKVLLPKKDKVITFMEAVGLLEHFHNQYGVIGSSAEHPPRHSQLENASSKQVFLLPRAARTYVFNNGNAHSIFRSDILRMHMFGLDSNTARSCCVAIYELINNVLDHSREVAGSVTIHFRRTERGTRKEIAGQLFVAVSDLGIGIRRSLEEEGSSAEYVGS